jgi:hypothetical protein
MFTSRRDRAVSGGALRLKGCEFATGSYQDFKFGLAVGPWPPPH